MNANLNQENIGDGPIHIGRAGFGFTICKEEGV